MTAIGKSRWMTVTLDHIERAIALSAADGFDVLAAQARMAPEPRPLAPPPGVTARQSAVLLLLYTTADGSLWFPLMRRTESTSVHSGQISLPGGRQEAGETFIETALREANEEIGIYPPDVRVLGELPSLYVPPSNFEIHPVVGTVPYLPLWNPYAGEVAEMVETPLSVLLDDSVKGTDMLNRNGATFRIHYYTVGAHRVWGATAALLGEFEMRLRRVVGG